MKHTVPHTYDLYKKTFLNIVFGKLYFKYFIKKKPAKDRYIILSFDPDETSDMDELPRLLATLKKYGMKCSIAAVGAWIEKYPQHFKRAIREGHEIINHTYSHPDSPQLNPRHYFDLTKAERKKEIAKCHAVAKKVLGIELKGFRTPHFGYQHTEDTYAILEELGYSFCTSTRAIDSPEGKPFRKGTIVEFPLSYCPRHPWALFDSSHAFRGRFLKHSKKDFMKNFEELLDSGVFLNIYLDPQDFDKFDFEELLKIIKKKKIKTKLYRDVLKDYQ
jgi:peptidoglycan-N-acetylglucosamine deacetylase